MHSAVRSLLAVPGAALFLAACVSNDAGGPRTASLPPAGPSVISGSGSSGGSGASSLAAISGPPECAAPLSDYQQIIDRDVETGYLNPSVYNRLLADLEPVKRTCAEGRGREAVSQLAGVKSRYGYR